VWWVLALVAVAFLLSVAATYLYGRRQEMVCRNELAGTGVQVEVREIGPAWLSAVMDERYFETVVEVRYSFLRFDDVVLGRLACFPNLDSLVFFETNVGDEGLRRLAKLKSLRRLNLFRTEITPLGLSYLEDLQIEELRIGPYWDNSSLPMLARLSQLESLTLQGCPDITDAGLEHLRPLKNLRLLRLELTGVTEEAAQRFEQSMPGLKVVQSNSHAPAKDP
jgi:hypothetical protein